MATLEQLEVALSEIEDAKKLLRDRIHLFNRLRTEYIQGEELPEEGKFFIGFYADGISLNTRIIFTCADDTVLLAISRTPITPPDYYVPTPYISHSEAEDAFRDNEEIMDLSVGHLLRCKVIDHFVTKYPRMRVPEFLLAKEPKTKKDDADG